MTDLIPVDLLDLEARIERGLATFIEVGSALLEIRDRRLYRERGFDRFEDYCRERWGFNRAHAYRLIESAHVAVALSPIGDTPANEAQARELARLREPDLIRDVWQEVRETAPEPTARDIRAVVDRRLNPDPTELRVRDLPSIPPVPQITPEERIWNRLSEMTAIVRLDPIEVARACPDAMQARMTLAALPALSTWAKTFIAELEAQARGQLRVVNHR